MGVMPEMKLVVKRTFLEYVEDDVANGYARARSFTDSSVHFAGACEKHAGSTSDLILGADDQKQVGGAKVNQSATEDLKAFLGLGRQEEFPSSPLGKVPGAPSKKNVVLPPLTEEQSPSESQSSTPCTAPPGTWTQISEGYFTETQSADSLAPMTSPSCGFYACWVPMTFDNRHVLQINDMITPSRDQQQDQYFNMRQQHQSLPPLSHNMMQSNGTSTSSSPPLVNKQDPDFKTTVIIRNLPNNYTRSMLVDLLDAEGFRLKYDLVYLPIDFNTQAGLGYAFVNLVSPADALAFWSHFEGFRRWSVPSEKVCVLNWSSPVQGLAGYIERYRNSPVMHNSVPDEWKPALYFRGVRSAFPPPTKAIKPPKVRNSVEVSSFR